MIFLEPLHTINLKIDTNQSTIYWKGSKISEYHDGNVDLKWGYLIIDHGTLVGGEFVIDMSTIQNTDIESERKRNYLTEHLKNEDFFYVTKYPEAKLIITNAKRKGSTSTHTITADLTIKDTTHSIVFDSDVTIKDSRYTANAKITIDRTKWDVVYNSGNFFKDLVADRVIKDEIEFEVQLISQAVK